MTRSTPTRRALFGVAGISLLVALGFGRPELVAFAAPFVIALAAASRAEPPAVEVAARVDRAAVIQGEDLTLTLTFRIDPDAAATECEAGVRLPPDVVTDDAIRWAFVLEPGSEVERAVTLRAGRWGAHRLGPVATRAMASPGLRVKEQIAEIDATVRVFPRTEPLRRGLDVDAGHLFSGDYVAPAAGEGIEFSHVRPFTRGDSVRRVNWRVTSRRGEVHVNLAHLERDADLVLFLDTFTDAHLSDETTLDLTVRGAATLARHHLARSDRVGLVSFGGMLRWLTAAMGRTHTHRVIEFLLDTREVFTYAWKDITLLPRALLPPSATVIAFSPLVDERALGALADLAARGFPLIVIDTLDEARIAAGASEEDEVAHRVWRMQRAMLRDRFAELGVPVVAWTGEAGLEAALAALPRRRRRVRAAR